MTNRARCVVCGGSMAGKRADAVTCSGACRVAKHQREKQAAKDKAEARAARKPKAAPMEAPQAGVDIPHGRLEETTRAKFDSMGILGYDEDPLAVQLLGMARALDLPGLIAPSSMTAMGKAFREAYREYIRDHGGAPDPTDPLELAQDEAAAMLSAAGAA